MITFSGLASGLDTSGITNQLVALERQQANVYQGRKDDLSSEKTSVNDLSTKLSSLKSALEALNAADEIGPTAATSGDESIVKVASSSAANPGTYDLHVGQLAQAETTVSDAQANTNGPGVAGTIDITVGTGSPVTINYTASDSLYSIASLINDADADAQASVLDMGDGTFKLMVTGDNTGSDGAMTFAETGGSLGFNTVGNEVVPAQNAQVTLNGVTISRSNNTISDLLPGVTFTLQGESGAAPATNLVIGRDAEATEEQLQAVVDAYNAVASDLNSELNFVGEGAQGALFGDSTLQRLQRELGAIMSNGFTHGASTVSVSAIGLELDRSGTLSINSANVASMLENDPGALQTLLIGEDSTSGLVGALTSMIDTYTRTGDGILKSKADSIDDRIDDYDDQIDRVNQRADALGERLTAQFAAFERAMIEMQASQNALASLFTLPQQNGQ